MFSDGEKKRKNKGAEAAETWAPSLGFRAHAGVFLTFGFSVDKEQHGSGEKEGGDALFSVFFMGTFF